mgnify:CR=1 FL=1
MTPSSPRLARARHTRHTRHSKKEPAVFFVRREKKTNTIFIVCCDNYDVKRSRHFWSKLPALIRSRSICRSSFLICLPTRALWRSCSNLSFVYFPWRRFASEIRARPSIVFGPVLAPPCNLQRPFLLIAGERQAVPLRVFAPQRWPGQSGPNRHSIPTVTSFFVSINYTPYKGYYYNL